MTAQLTLEPRHRPRISSRSTASTWMPSWKPSPTMPSATTFSREFWGREHIRAFITKEFTGYHVTIEPVEAVDNAGHVVRAVPLRR